MANLRKALDRIPRARLDATRTVGLKHPEWLFIREPEAAWTEDYREDDALRGEDWETATFYDRPDLLVAIEDEAEGRPAHLLDPTPRGLEEVVTPHPNAQGLWYGPSQDWYPEEWQQRSGCGPTSASLVTAYLARSRAYPGCERLYLGAHPLPDPEGGGVVRKADWEQHMREIWHFVTPTPMGTWKLTMYQEGIERFAQSRSFRLGTEALWVRPALASRRPERLYDEIKAFVVESLERDLPVAFLNYFGGEMRDISNWHWVTVTEAQATEDGEYLWLTVSDQGMKVVFSLNQWLYTSFGGGGFVRFLV